MMPFVTQSEIVRFAAYVASGPFGCLFEHDGKIHRHTIGRRLFRGLHIFDHAPWKAVA